MENHFLDNTFLARWVAGELTPKELESFKKSKDYATFKRINDTSQMLEAPTYNEQALFNKLKQLRTTHHQAKSRVIKLIPNWTYSVAASVIIIFGIFYFTNNNKHFETNFSEQLAIILPDNSKVELNANSQLDYKSKNWKENRDLILVGEAFFDVEKGSSFKVNTNKGVIEVLGTEFNINVRDDYFEVLCFEGRVKVTSSNNEAILLPGNAIRIVNNNAELWNFEQGKPNWLQEESIFNRTPLSQVIISLENRFKVSFDKSNIDQSKRFTGVFTHKDLKLALKTVFIPMEISYKPNQENTIIILDSIK